MNRRINKKKFKNGFIKEFGHKPTKVDYAFFLYGGREKIYRYFRLFDEMLINARKGDTE